MNAIGRVDTYVGPEGELQVDFAAVLVLIH